MFFKNLAFYIFLALNTATASELFQIDKNSEGYTAISVFNYDEDLNISLMRTTWDGGALSDLSLGLIHLYKGVKFLAGPAFRNKDGNNYGVKVSAERFHSGFDYNYYINTSLNTIENDINMVFQLFNKNSNGVELNIGKSSDYKYQNFALNHKINNKLSLRTGYRINKKDFFVGFSYNTF